MQIVCNTKKYFYSTLLFLVFYILPNNIVYALSNNENKNYIAANSTSDIPIDTKENSFNNEYILDSGDILKLCFNGLDIYSKDYFIDITGYINLPEIGNYYARGKTISEINIELNKKFEEFIYDPDIKIKFKSPRPSRIFVHGEIGNPGFYDVSGEKMEGTVDLACATGVNKVATSEKMKGGDKENITSFPRLFDVLKASGGVTTYADLSKIEVIRKNSNSMGGGSKMAKINLLDLILNGKQANNIVIYDDDIIKIPKSSMVLKDQILAVNKINLNPEFINIFMSGNVENSGPTKVRKGSNLVQAIASTGGKKIFSGKVEFIRFTNEGEVERRLIKYDPNAKPNTFSNPLLLRGDIINVRLTAVGVVTSALNEITSPIFTGYGLIELFGD